MDVLSKLVSSVSSTVSTLSNALPGNPVTRDYEVTNQICTAGPGLLWKVYQGYKKSTKQEAAVFVFEKKLLERWPRESRESILESLKRGVSQLTKLRHPQILIVQHPLEDSRDSLAFATEPVFASLANVLGNHDNISSATPASFRDYKHFDIEIKYGLLQVAEGLAFLHTDVKLLHNNICPESIVINHQGAWKIFGFDFCLHNESKIESSASWSCSEQSHYLPHVAQPNLDYLAPEAGIHNVRTPACDLFSFGVLIHAMYNNGAPPVAYHDDFSSFKNRIGELKNLNINKFKNIPESLCETEKMLLNFNPELRPDAHQLKRIDYFEDVGVKTLNYLDSLFQWDKLQKSQFYKGLPLIISNFPHRVCLFRVVPCLGKEFTNPSMVPFVLPAVFQIAEKCTKDEFMQHIFKYFQIAMKMTDPIQILLIFMQKMELLLKLTPGEEVKSDVLPMLYRALDSDAQQIQELCLSVLPTYSSLIDYPAMKNALLPRIKRLALNTSYLSVRVNCLVCIGKLLGNLDKWLVLDEVLPFLPQVPSREPAVLMGILGIYKITLTHKKLGIPKEVIATKVIPFLMPMTIENGLTLSQFNTLFTVLRDMVNRVETEHRTKLEQLNAITQQTNALSKGNSTVEMKESTAVRPDLDSLFSSSETLKGTEPSSGLSMEEKRNLIRQREAADKLSVQSSPIAPTVAPTKSIPQPRDLTSSLMDTNLALVTSNWTPQVTSPSGGTSSHTFGIHPAGINTFGGGFAKPMTNTMTMNSGVSTSVGHPWQMSGFTPMSNMGTMQPSMLNQPQLQFTNSHIQSTLPNYDIQSKSSPSSKIAGAIITVLTTWILVDPTYPVIQDADNYFNGFIVQVVVGILLLLVGALGCCGALKESQCLLVAFFSVLLVVIVAQISTVVWAYMNLDQLHELFKVNVEKTVAEDYGTSPAYTNTFDLIQQDLKCCGALGPKDWASSKYSSGEAKKIDFTITSPEQKYWIPPSCCSTEEKDAMCASARHGTLGAEVGSVIFSVGCIEKLSDYVEYYYPIIIGLAVTAALLEIVGLILSIILCCAVRFVDRYKA